MYTYERQLAILNYLKEHHTASVLELSKKFFISETSIRRDLDKLDRAGLIHKSYGGAVIVQGINEVMALEARSRIDREAKSIIAKKAISLIHENSVLFLDSSSTSLAMAPYFENIGNVTVITNGIKLASALSEFPNCNLYVLGGEVTSHTHSIHSSFAIRMLDEMHADFMFFSPKAVDMDGNAYCADPEEANIRRIMMQKCEKSVLMCDMSKFNHFASFKVCNVEEVYTLICESIPNSDILHCLKESNVNLM